MRNLMAHTQKPHFFFRLNGRVHLNRRGVSVQLTAGNRGVRISGSNAGYTMLRGRVSVLATHSIRQFPLHFPSRASPCAVTFRTQYTTQQWLLLSALYLPNLLSNGHFNLPFSEPSILFSHAPMFSLLHVCTHDQLEFTKSCTVPYKRASVKF